MSRGRGVFLAASAAGAGEGAVAAAAASANPLIPAGLPPTASEQRGGAGRGRGDEVRETEDISESNFDQFTGYGEKLYDVSAPYDSEDREADDIYESVDQKMDDRRSEKREASLKESLERFLSFLF